jgi:hypothetical protein
VLYRRTPSGRMLYVPADLRYPLLVAFHDHLGHIPRDQLMSVLSKRYYWPYLAKDVAEYTSECHECTLAKPPNARNNDPKGPTLGHYPFDVLYADILDMADTHNYDKEKALGFRKLIVFVDSLSRWVEAVPLHTDPTSEQILDIFMEHVVCRHGTPRRIVTDSGSNLASRLCDAILKETNVDLRPTTAEHHEAVGTVERFNRTLTNMTRASDEGGWHWSDHLPFLLMAHRATPNRITGMSPAMILYGREIRLPAQIGDDAPAPDALLADDATAAPAVRSYAARLHQRLCLAWQAAHHATRGAQGEAVSDALRRSTRAQDQYQVDDRVVRRLYGAANKLENVYAGPYRIAEVLGHGRYKLTDLENNLIKDEFDVSNLRRYRTHVDAEELQSDEYLVDELIRHRDRTGAREYLVKWRQYPRSQATWEPRSELQRRCAELVQKYEDELKRARNDPNADADRNQPRVRRGRPAGSRRRERPNADLRNTDGVDLTGSETLNADLGTPPTGGVNPTGSINLEDADLGTPTGKALQDEAVDSYLPTVARYTRGQWYYGRRVGTPRGPTIRYYPSKNYTQTELDSDHFEKLRTVVNTDTYADAQVAAVFHAMTCC